MMLALLAIFVCWTLAAITLGVALEKWFEYLDRAVRRVAESYTESAHAHG